MKILNSANPSLNPKRTNEGHSEWLRLQWTKCTQKIEGVLFFLAIQSNKIRSNHVQKIRERDRTAMKGGRRDFFIIIIFHQRRTVESKSTGEKFESQHWWRSALSRNGYLWLIETKTSKNHSIAEDLRSHEMATTRVGGEDSGAGAPGAAACRRQVPPPPVVSTQYIEGKWS